MCGLETALTLGGFEQRIIPHSLRAAYINYARRQGVSFVVIRANVVHEDEKTTRKYYEVITADLRAQEGEKHDATLAELRRLVGWTTPKAA